MNWYGKLWDRLGGQYLDFLSLNTVHLPEWTVRLLRAQAQRDSDKRDLLLPGVGQQCTVRPTTLISDRPGSGVPPSTFAWHALKASWLSRPYGVAESVFAPRIHFCYYEMRIHDVTHYVPRSGWTGLECDNSPHAGFQAVTCMRHLSVGAVPGIAS